MNTSWQDILSPTILPNLFFSFLAVLIILWLRRVVLRIAHQRVDDPMSRYQWQKNSTYLAVVLILLLIGPMWISDFRYAATYLGLLSAGLAISLQGLVTNFAGWLFIMFRHPFRVGDRIQIGDYAGDVVDVRFFQFLLMEIGNWVDAEQSTGRVINLPNGMVFSQPIANYSQGFYYIWNEIPVLLTFESNWQKAEELLLAIVNQHSAHLSDTAEQKAKETSRRFLFFYNNLTPIIYVSVKDSGIMLTLRYLCEPKLRRNTSHAIWKEILLVFAEQKDIDFAYPTQRFYNNVLEGKPGARAVVMSRDMLNGETNSSPHSLDKATL